MDQCMICANDFTQCIRKAIQCEYCEFVACKTCSSTYLLSVNKPGCMNRDCLGEWSRKFISDNLSRNFANTRLKQHRSDILYQEQIALLPATQLICEEEDRKQAVRDKIRELERERMKLYLSLDILRGELYIPYSDARRAANILRNKIRLIPKVEKAKKAAMRKELDDLDAKLPTMYQEYNASVRKLEDDTIGDELSIIDVQTKELSQQLRNTIVKKREFIKKCSDPECRGFLSTRWKCGMCHKSTCSECHELKSDDGLHTCNPDTIATAKLLSMDTKACPKCQTNIYKIDGCDQMWCTQCHTAFSWVTGAIETKIHNPHYYAWKRLNGGVDREPGDVVCGNEMNHYLAGHIRYALDTNHSCAENTELYLKNAEIYVYISNVIRNCLHIIHVMIPDLFRKFRLYGINTNITFADLTVSLRKGYLRKYIDLEQFKAELEKIDRNWSKTTELRQVFELFHNTVKDILFRFKQNIDATQNGLYDHTILSEIGTIVSYVNECLNNIGVVYLSSSVYHFKHDLSFVKTKPIRNATKNVEDT